MVWSCCQYNISFVIFQDLTPSLTTPSLTIQDYTSIEERPAEIADRIIPGHWEGDLLMGYNNGSALGTLVKGTTLMTFLVQLKDKDATAV